MAEMLDIMKRAAVDAVNAGKPVTFVFGTVLTADPLEIQLDQKMILERQDLVLTRNVTNYETAMTVDHATGKALAPTDLTHTHENRGTTGAGGTDGHTHTYTAATASGGYHNLTHTHAYDGEKIFGVRHALKAGESVLLARLQGGRKYIVLDRLEE